jgi:hypothetical protein
VPDDRVAVSVERRDNFAIASPGTFRQWKDHAARAVIRG